MLYVRLAVAVIAICFAFPAWAASILVGTSDGTVGKLDTTTSTISDSFNVNSGVDQFGELVDIAVDGNGNAFAFGVIRTTNPFTVTFLSIDPDLMTFSSVGSPGMFLNALAFDASSTLYGAQGGTLYTVDTSNGVSTAVGAGIGSGYDSSGDLAFGPGGVLYGTSKSGCGGGGFDCLFSIDPGTGVGTKIGSNLGFGAVYGLAFIDGLLYGLTQNDELITINTMTGVGTSVLNYAIDGLTYGAAVPAPVPLPAALPLLLAALGFFGLIARRRSRMEVA